MPWARGNHPCDSENKHWVCTWEKESGNFVPTMWMRGSHVCGKPAVMHREDTADGACELHAHFAIKDELEGMWKCANKESAKTTKP